MQLLPKFYKNILKIRTALLKPYSLNIIPLEFCEKKLKATHAISKRNCKPFLGLHLYLIAIVTQYALRYAYW